MLRRLKVQGYKSLYDVEIDFKPLTVLFGPNATGKSNVLDVLQLLSCLTNARTLKEAFDPPYRGKPLESFAFGREGILGLLQQESASFSIEVDVELSPRVVRSVQRRIDEMRRPLNGEGKSPPKGLGPMIREKNLRYRIAVETLPKSGILRVTDEYLAALNSSGEPTKKRKPFLEKMDDKIHVRMEGQAHPTYHDLLLDHAILSMPHYPPHHPHMVAMRQELASWFFFYFEPRERMRVPSPVKEASHIGLMGEDLAAFLNTLKALSDRQFRAIERSLHMLIPSITGIDVEINSLGEVELKVIEGDMPVPARVLSEGTLRALGLLALGGAPDPPALIGFEEPENGIHPRRIQMIAELLRTRAETGDSQLIITTHSPTLLDYLPDVNLLACSKGNGKTVINRLNPWGPLFSENRSGEIDEILNEEQIIQDSPSKRILRGDFDA